MATKTRVVTHSPAIRAMLQSDEIREGALRPVSEPIRDNMAQNAPRESGDLSRSIQIWDDTTDRAVQRIGSDLPYAPTVEARTGFMSRSIDAGGGL